jgi:hypothetical protein
MTPDDGKAQREAHENTQITDYQRAGDGPMDWGLSVGLPSAERCKDCFKDSLIGTTVKAHKVSASS